MLPGHKPTDGPAYDIHRLKGRFFGKGGKEKIIQGVREIFDIFDSPAQEPDVNGSRAGKLVLIGRHLGDFNFQESLEDALREGPPT